MKFIHITVLALSSLLAVTFANAKDLRIYNGTDNSITFKINHNCSNEFGVVSANREKIISTNDFNLACKKKSTCQAEIYEKDNCSGQKMADVVFDKSASVKNIKAFWGYLIHYSDRGLIIFPPLIGGK